jgi:hypothetical protein
MEAPREAGAAEGKHMTGHDHSDTDETRDLDSDDAVEEQKIRYNPLKAPVASTAEDERIRWNPLDKPRTGI